MNTDPPYATTRGPAACPRCGYDLRGEIAQWRDRCPRVGRCVECGFDFAWADIFYHARHEWLFEREWRFRPVRRILRTIRHAFKPRRFWRDVKLADPVALLPPLLVMAGVGLLFFVVFVGWGVYQRHHAFQWRRRGKTLTEYWLDLVGQAAEGVLLGVAHLGAAPAILLLGMPLAFAMLPITLRVARVRRAHIARIWIYSLIAPTIVTTAWGLLQLGLLSMSFGATADALNPWHWARRVPFHWHVLRAIHGDLPGLAIGVVVTAWIAAWWGRACRRYLMLPETKRILAVLLIVLWLAALSGQLYL